MRERIVVDPNLLDKMPLTDHQKKLLLKLDYREEQLTKIASELGKTKSTISVQHKKAQKIYLKTEKALRKTSVDMNRLKELEKKVNILWKYLEYLGSLQVWCSDQGPSKLAKCVYHDDTDCTKLRLPAEAILCGLCGYFKDKLIEPRPHGS